MTTRSRTRPRSHTTDVPTEPVQDVEVLVIGGGQAGLSAANVLAQRGFVPHEEFLVLDANDSPGGAWQHRWRRRRPPHPSTGLRTVGQHDRGQPGGTARRP